MKIPESILIVNADKPSAANDVSKSISKLKLKQNESTKKTIQELEATIADPATSFIEKTRARLELALLREKEGNEQSRIKKEIDAIKGAAGVAKTKDKLERGILTNEELLQREKAIRSHQEDLAKEALQRRIDAKRRAEEQRKKAKDAEELLSQLEKEAEEAVAKAKDAMKKANAARVEAGKEQKKALELEAQNEELQHMEDDSPTNYDEVCAVKTTSLIKIAPSPRDARAASIRRQRSKKDHDISQQKSITFEPFSQQDIIQRELHRVESELNELTKFSPEWCQLNEELVELNIKLGESQPVNNVVNLMEEKRKDEQLEQDRLNALGNLSDHLKDDTTSQRSSGSDINKSTGEGYATKYFQLSIKLEELQKERDELDACLKEREASLDSLRGKNKLHEENIMSLNECIKEAGQTELYWKHQSQCLAWKLELAQQTKSEQEEEVTIMKDQLDMKLKEIDELKAEIDDLRQTKDQLEAELSTVEETQRSVLLELKGEADALIEEKEHALNTLQIVQDSHLKVLADHEEQINALGGEIAAYKKELEDVKAVLDEKEREVTESKTMQDDEVKQLSEECRRWKKKATTLNFKLDVLKYEAKAQKKEIARLTKSSVDQDKLSSDYKLLKKKAKDMQFKLGVLKMEVKQRDVIIDELTKQALPTEAVSLPEEPDGGQRGAAYWKDGKISLSHHLRIIEMTTLNLSIVFSHSL